MKEWLEAIGEYVEGVGPIEVSRVNGSLTEDGAPIYWIRDASDGAMLIIGEGRTLEGALSDFVERFEKEYPPC